MWFPRLLIAVMLFCAACGSAQTDIDPSPGVPDDAADSTSSSTTAPDDDSDPDGDDVETSDSTRQTTSTVVSNGTDPNQTTVVIDESSVNAPAYIELAASGLVLSLDEQECADDSVDAGVGSGLDRIDAVITAVKECASPVAVDDFASQLISAGGQPLPPDEAACVASLLRIEDDFRPFWVALLEEEPFDFLAVDTEVQNRYLDLYSECVSVGRALSDQLDESLSSASMGCIDSLYSDREFVRTTILADLSGDSEELERVDSNIASCLTTDELDRLGLG